MLKRTPRDELLDAIREVHRGGSPMTTHIARKVVLILSARRAAQHRPRKIFRRASRKCWIASRKVFSTRKSPRN